jgi:phosphoglucosamine mutase
VRVARKEDFSQHPEIHKIMEEVKNQLGKSGRMNVRYSGTEPLARVMIEGEDQSQIESQARRIASVIFKYLG